ncbi:MAG: hypothetical protein KJZ62_05510 [Fimbriimonadaceae bacterium]|nr:hypothetical protein [Fimbriimonadaceae bacterium]MCL4284539.1 hypothetical protein [Fimbriimonadaceae bacterium]QOJ12093.1 MAG: hypothetical protein HRU74_08540 [Chthonomonadaceae bacterium]
MDRTWIADGWTVDYGSGPTPVTLPHAWGQEVDVRWEGPATYRTALKVPDRPCWLVLDGVSYAAEVRIEGSVACHHKGVWDSFSVDLSPWIGTSIAVEVEVVKNGGPTYPVRSVASGFLPFVFHTFGGLYGGAFLSDANPNLLSVGPPPEPRVAVEGNRLFVDGEPFYVRGALSWGWYSSIGHPNPPDDLFRTEVRRLKELGFNLYKFCLWVPRRRMLEILEEEGMFAWIELPLWDPSPTPSDQEQILRELEAIVRQYLHFSNVIAWTCGCELSSSTSAEFRRRLYERVKQLTGCPLVKDNSGGSEMYGGELEEFGDFADFHPYCDLPFFEPVLQSLSNWGRLQKPILLGETNDADTHRDLAKLRDAAPYWASPDPRLNDPGVRWVHDLPAYLQTSRFAVDPKGSDSAELLLASYDRARFLRREAADAMRRCPDVAGYVVTGLRDTPISTAGMFDDFDQDKFSPSDLDWNRENRLLLLPSRRPPWIHGGNRPGWIDPYNHYAANMHFRVGFHGTRTEASLACRIMGPQGETLHQAIRPPVATDPHRATEVGAIACWIELPGRYLANFDFAETRLEVPFWVHPALTDEERTGFLSLDPCEGPQSIGSGERNVEIHYRFTQDTVRSLEASGALIALLTGPETRGAPFWRECAHEFDSGFWGPLGARGRYDYPWERLLPVSADSVLKDEFVESLRRWGTVEVLLRRIDLRSYKEEAVMVEVRGESHRSIFTTLRPFGGLGTQPIGVGRNPAGAALLRRMIEYALGSPD